MSNWTQPLCVNCWVQEEGTRLPTRLREPDLERCCMCGNRTISGIYTRRDPAVVPFPRLGDRASDG